MAFIRFIVLAFLSAVCYNLGQIPSNEANAIAVVGSALFFLTVPALYLLPTYEAFANKQPNLTSIFLVNLFFGWTFLGWAVAMIWAFNKPASVVVVDTRDHAIAPAYAAPAASAMTKNCPFCAESIKAEAKVCRYCQRDQPVQTANETGATAPAVSDLEAPSQVGQPLPHGITLENGFYVFKGFKYEKLADAINYAAKQAA